MNKPTDDCGFATAIKMVEGKWKIQILCELGTSSRRFGRLRQSIPAISEKMLAQQLRELEADGLVDRKVYPESPAKVVYSLTERGAALNAGAAALCRWGEQFRSRADAQMQAASVAAKARDDVMPSVGRSE
jgi:DNA-binding HxlR family transcriptional regulator